MRKFFKSLRNKLLALTIILIGMGSFGISINAEGNIGVHYSVYDLNTHTFSNYYDGGAEAGGNGVLSAVKLDIDDVYDGRGQIKYRTHNANVGWYDWVINDQVVGDDANPIQAIRVTTTGSLRYYVDVYYRLYSPVAGWSGWARNGEVAGSEGLGRDCTVLQVLFAQKGIQPDGQVGNAYSQKPWTWPVPGYNSISSPFGPRDGAHHDGFDIPAPSGAPIVSAKNGIVKMAAPDGNFGNCVCVQHDSGEVVYYAHMSRVGCQVGQRVLQGQVIGFVGTTGNSTGNHLHMEIYNDWDENVDPLTFY